VQYADSIVHLPGDGTVEHGDPAELLAHSSVAPPIVELGRLAGWTPLPLSVRDARRRAEPLLAELAATAPPPAVPHRVQSGDALLTARGIVVRYGPVIAVRDVDLELRPGEIVALMGRNGAGKSSLLWALQGTGARQGGKVDTAGRDPGHLTPDASRALVGLVPQSPGDLLYLDTVGEELAQADAESGAEPGRARVTLDRLAPGIDIGAHPRDLSEGQRLALVLAIQLVASPRIALLDEPTRGLDYRAKRELARVLGDLAAGGHAIVVATHDVEFVAMSSQRVVVMAEGEIVADGPTDAVIVASPSFAPQVAKILAPRSWLTVEQVRAAGVFAEAGA
jgi:energy-coupling factor transport system ATP-binding protein